MKAQRLDRNGIPILDAPRESNRLPQRCHETLHEWVETRSITSQRRSGIYIVRVYQIVRECAKCRMHEEFEETIRFDTREDRA